MTSQLCQLIYISIAVAVSYIIIVAIEGPFLMDDNIGKNNALCQRLTPKNMELYQHFMMLDDGIELEYFHIGNTKSDNILLVIHGVLSDGSISVDNNEMFKELNLNVISPSLPGWGMSTINASNPYSFNITCVSHQLMELMTKLGYNKFMVAGWSAGAMYAIGMASLYPDNIQKMGLYVPVSPYHTLCNPFSNYFKQQLRILPARQYIRDILSMVFSKIAVNGFIPNIDKNNTSLKNNMKRCLCQTWKGLTSMNAHIISDYNGINWDNIKAKTLIISHLNDTLNIPSMQQCLHNKIKSSTLKEVPNMNHFDIMKTSQNNIQSLLLL